MTSIVGPKLELVDNKQVNNIQKYIDEVQNKSIKLYLYRQQLEQQNQQLQSEINRTNQEFIRLDGELNILQRMQKESSGE